MTEVREFDKMFKDKFILQWKSKQHQFNFWREKNPNPEIKNSWFFPTGKSHIWCKHSILVSNQRMYMGYIMQYMYILVVTKEVVSSVNPNYNKMIT